MWGILAGLAGQGAISDEWWFILEQVALSTTQAHDRPVAVAIALSGQEQAGSAADKDTMAKLAGMCDVK